MRFYKLDSFDRFFSVSAKAATPKPPCSTPGGKVGTREDGSAVDAAPE